MCHFFLIARYWVIFGLNRGENICDRLDRVLKRTANNVSTKSAFKRTRLFWREARSSWQKEANWCQGKRYLQLESLKLWILSPFNNIQRNLWGSNPVLFGKIITVSVYIFWTVLFVLRKYNFSKIFDRPACVPDLFVVKSHINLTNLCFGSELNRPLWFVRIVFSTRCRKLGKYVSTWPSKLNTAKSGQSWKYNLCIVNLWRNMSIRIPACSNYISNVESTRCNSLVSLTHMLYYKCTIMNTDVNWQCLPFVAYLNRIWSARSIFGDIKRTLRGNMKCDGNYEEVHVR